MYLILFIFYLLGTKKMQIKMNKKGKENGISSHLFPYIT